MDLLLTTPAPLLLSGLAYDLAMTRRFIGVRWWLGAAFAVVAATSTAIVVSQFSTRSENAFRGHAQELTLADARFAARRATPANLARLPRQLTGPPVTDPRPATGRALTAAAV